ncbi:TRDC protein, partial [Aegotheles bennettii]|nr:TRDC protein [Aegotheles bennettii]
LKSKKLKEDGSIGKAACLARNYYPKNISLEMPSSEVIYEQSTSILTSEGLYNTIKVVNVENDRELTCMAKFNGSIFTPDTEELPGTILWYNCNLFLEAVSSSAQYPKMERANMLSVAVLGLRVLLAKSIAFNTLMSIKLFLF